MAAKDLIMLDEGEDAIKEEDIKNIAIVISDNCMLNGSVLTMPLNEALSISANISIQVAMLI